MKKNILSAFLIIFIFSGFSVISQEADDDFFNMIESTLSDTKKVESESSDETVGKTYVEGEDDNKVQPVRTAQTDDTIDDPYAEKDNLKEEQPVTNNSMVQESEQEEEKLPAQENIEESESKSIEIPNSDEIVQSIYGVPEKKSEDDEYGEDISSITVTIPGKQKPKAPDGDKLSAAKKKDEDNSDYEKKMETLKFGTPGEISSVVDEVVENDDPRFIDQLYELFYLTSSNEVRSKILDYFSKNEDPCLSDYVVEILDDPYDVTNSFASKCMEYATKVKCKEAAPALVKILEGENEDYFNAALSALGKTGGKKEAKYLAHYLERDDLETPMRQALMRTLGQMNAVETWDQIVEIAQDEDENGFVRQYAAEALGNMKKEESIPILINLYENGDPNMREYCIKGLLNFPDSEKAKNMILQGIRDEHVKVRLQSIKACREMKYKAAVDYLIYRAKNDNETSVKKESYPAIAELDTKEGNKFLIERITDTKAPDSAKNMAAEALLKYNKDDKGVKEINELALSVVEDDRRKPLRKGIGRLLAKYPKSEFGEVCGKYIASKDADTCGLGIDMYKSGRYDEAKAALQTLADAKTGNVANRKRARKLLGMDEDLSSEKK